MTLATLKRLCHESRGNVTWRDSMIAAGIMLAGALVFAILGVWLARIGWPVASRIAMMMGFPGTFVLAMPFMGMGVRSRRAQAVITTGTLALLLLIAWIAALT